MHAQLKYLDSTQTPDLETFIPPDSQKFGILVNASIGSNELPVENNFLFFICSPGWMQEMVKDGGFIFGKSHIIIEYYNYKLIWRLINDLCNRTFGTDWATIAEKLRCYGEWEFDDYHDEST